MARQTIMASRGRKWRRDKDRLSRIEEGLCPWRLTSAKKKQYKTKTE